MVMIQDYGDDLMPRKKVLKINNGKEKKDPRKKIVKRFAYYEDGKRKGKTFTAYSEAELAQKIAEWNLNHSYVAKPSMTVLDALNLYVATKEPALSPSTVRGYESIIRNQIEAKEIGSIALGKLTSTDIQTWINDAIMAKKSPKTISNWYGLLQSGISLQNRRFDFSKITLPMKKKYIGYTPSDDNVKILIDYAKGLDTKDLYISLMLAAFGPMRRSEICALTSDDIVGNTIRISKAKVKNKDGAWVIKDIPKTTESERIVNFPDFVMDEIKGIKGPLVTITPNALYHRFLKAIKKANLPDFRFHDLRHYSASIMHAIGVPDAYIKQRGGWSSDYVMKRVYIEAMEEEKKKQSEKIFNHFEHL